MLIICVVGWGKMELVVWWIVSLDNTVNIYVNERFSFKGISGEWEKIFSSFFWFLELCIYIGVYIC